MKQAIHINTDRGQYYVDQIDVPDICPLCGTRMDAKFIKSLVAYIELERACEEADAFIKNQ
mgnify:CR=1 FL=1